MKKLRETWCDFALTLVPYPPKAEATGSNPVGRANNFKGLLLGVPGAHFD